MVSVSNRTIGACSDALLQTSLVRLTHGETPDRLAPERPTGGRKKVLDTPYQGVNTIYQYIAYDYG